MSIEQERVEINTEEAEEARLQAVADAKQAEAAKAKAMKMPWLRLMRTSECMRKKHLRLSLSYNVLSLC
jgi:predicted DNA-binding protein (UPF0251 family)